MLKVASRVQKIEVFKKGWNFASCSFFASLQVPSWKNFFMKERNSFFFLIFTMKVSSAALSYLNAHSTLNFARTFLYSSTTLIKHQRSKIWILPEGATFFGSSYREVCWKLMSGNKLSDLQLYRHFWGFWSHLSDLF